LSAADQRRIEHWRELHPDYEIKLWNEKNFDIDANFWTREAYRAKNYALVSDIIRIYALRNEGGIYLDTDVELLRPLDDLLKYEGFLGFDSSRWANSAIIGSAPNTTWIKKIWRRYDGTRGAINMATNLKTVYCLAIVARSVYGIQLNGKTQEKDDFVIFERHVLAPKHFATGCLEITPATRAIHHFASTWQKPLAVQSYRLLYNVLGQKLAAATVENLVIWYYQLLFKLEDRKLGKQGS